MSRPILKPRAVAQCPAQSVLIAGKKDDGGAGAEAIPADKHMGQQVMPQGHLLHVLLLSR